METKSNEAAVAGKQKAVSIKKAFNLPLNIVWKAWSEPESFKKWWGPDDYTCPDCTIDFKPGGKCVASMESKDGQKIWSTCTFSEIIPMKKIVYNDSFADSNGNKVPASYYNMPGEWPDESIVTLTFEEVNGKTNMTLRHEGIPEEMHDDCTNGWQQSLDKLERNLK